MGEAVLYAYNLCGIRGTALTQQHFETARMAANIMQGLWSANGVNLWQVQLGSIALVQGCGTYQLPTNIISLLDGYYTINTGAAEIDRIMLPVSRSEYATYPNKQMQGSPTVFWFDRLLSPAVNLWPVPDGQQACFKYYYLRQTQDAVLSNGTQLEMPIYFLEAFTLGLAYRLALIWAPTQVPVLKPLADEAWAIAAKQNVETESFYVSPMVSGYWRL
jgi:hypothetical protein